jgi:hypothetical protein
MGWTFYNASGQQLRNTGTVLATQAEMEAGSSIAAFVTPGRTHNHPGVAKAWCKWNNDGTIAGSINYPDSYNIASITDVGTGDRDVVWATDFSQTTYVVVPCNMQSNNLHVDCELHTVAQTSMRVVNADFSGLGDQVGGVVAFGDQ